jgi:thiosulfate/3-mercaptopyruvate sulfurtransferase
LLLEPAALVAAKELIVLDARGRKDFDEARIPGARWVDALAWAKAFGQGTDAKSWSERIGALGIAATSKVVVYDDASLKDAARIWWILRYWGVEDARILNGAWKGWKASGNAIEKSPAAAVKSTAFEAKPRREKLATKDELLGAVRSKGGGLQILDTRSEGEYCGTEKQSNPRGGAIPGAKHLEWSDLLEKETQRFKPAAELRKLFEGAGIDLKKPVATHCQSGGRASVAVFGLELLGAPAAKNYYASWAEWSADASAPVETHEPKGKEQAP